MQCSTERTAPESDWSARIYLAGIAIRNKRTAAESPRMPPVVSAEDSAGFMNILAAHVERAPLLERDPDLDDWMEPRTWL